MRRSGAGDGESWRRKAARSVQYPDNPYAHYTTTGPEIWQQTAGASLILSPAWGRPALSPASTLYARTIQTGDHCRPATGRGSSIPGIRRWPTEYLPGIFNVLWWMRCWIFISAMRKTPCATGGAGRNILWRQLRRRGCRRLRVAKANPGAVVVAIICDRAIATFPPGCLGKSILVRGRGLRLLRRHCFIRLRN